MEPSGAPVKIPYGYQNMQGLTTMPVVNQYGQMFIPIQSNSPNNMCLPSVSSYVPMVPTQNRYSPLLDQEYPPLPSSREAYNEQEIDMFDCVNPYIAEGVNTEIDKSATKRRATDVECQQPQTKKYNSVNNGGVSSQVPKDGRKEINMESKQRQWVSAKLNINKEFEIPEEELFKIGMIIEVKEEDESKRFPEDFRLSKCMKELLKENKFEFEVLAERRKIFIFVKNDIAAEKILKQSQMCGLAIEAKRKVETVRGIIKGVPLEVSEDDILDSIDSPIAIIGAKRQKRFNREIRKMEDSLAILLTFENNFLPPVVWMGGRRRIVHEYKRQLLQCHKCQRYGHVKKYCPAKEEICLRCAGKHTSGLCQMKNNNIQNKTSLYKCINCYGNHPSTSMQCSVRQRNTEILKVAERHQMSFRRAEIVYRSYAEVTNKQAYKEQAKINVPLRDKETGQMQQRIVSNIINKIVIGLVLSPEILSIENLPIREKVDKLCNFIESLGIMQMNSSLILNQCVNK